MSMSREFHKDKTCRPKPLRNACFFVTVCDITVFKSLWFCSYAHQHNLSVLELLSKGSI